MPLWMMVYMNINSSSDLMLVFLSKLGLSLLRRSSHCWILEMVGFSSRVFTTGAIKAKKEDLKSMY